MKRFVTPSFDPATSTFDVIRDGIIDSCLLILHDWANDLTLDPKEIDNERGVIHEEWRSGQGAMMRMYEKTFPIMYAGSKYGHRLPIGTIEVIDNFPHQALRDYYEKWYRPDQQGIIVVGDVDVDKVEAKIKEMFSPIEMPANPAPREYNPVPDNKEPIVTIAKDKEQPQTMIYIWHKHPATPNEAKGNIGYLVQNYLIYMVESMLNARLNELTQSAEPPFIGAGAEDTDFLLAKTTKAFAGVAITKDNGIESGFAALLREMERARKFGFTESEYSRAKAALSFSMTIGTCSVILPASWKQSSAAPISFAPHPSLNAHINISEQDAELIFPSITMG